jgi:hypothetical protein
VTVADAQAIRDYVRRQLADNPPPPLSGERIARLRALLGGVGHAS